MNWLIALSVMMLLGAAVVRLRAAEQSFKPAAVKLAAGGESAFTGAEIRGTPSPGESAAGGGATNTAGASATTGANSAPPGGSVKQHPPASAPEESATIKDDPTTAPDPSQSADNNVSFPTDI